MSSEFYNQLAKKIALSFPNLSPDKVGNIMPSTFKVMVGSEITFPSDGDDEAFGEWFTNVYTPYIKSIEENSNLGDWY